MIQAPIMNNILITKHIIYPFICITLLLVSACRKDTRRNTIDSDVDNQNDGIEKKVEFNKNILKDCKFENGNKHWKSNASTIFTNINNISFCYIKGSSSQNRVYQSINVADDTLYRFSFDLNTDKNQGAFVIFRDETIKKEKYYYCNKRAGKNHYQWDFFPFASGPARIFLSTYSVGDFYFSNVSLVPVSVYEQLFSKLIVSSPLFLIPFFLLIVFYYKKI